jgi:hypothetical protein
MALPFSAAFAPSPPLATAPDRPTSAAQGGASTTFVNSISFWAIIAAFVLALAVLILVILWRHSSQSTRDSIPPNTLDSTDWPTNDTGGTEEELGVDCDNPLWNSDDDRASDVVEITDEDEGL